MLDIEILKMLFNTKRLSLFKLTCFKDVIHIIFINSFFVILHFYCLQLYCFVMINEIICSCSNSNHSKSYRMKDMNHSHLMLLKVQFFPFLSSSKKYFSFLFNCHQIQQRR